ncbi:hypothetical protein IFM89_000399 [Coptis chinensis]|uniref:Uncharacterized protein n=1 Tax=Coptis chinensis TaxID=261450 RepID=A0A835LQ47_9MAGN|nr:hypothetical protein IFM89_000399 [Coptis chinensis]
MLHLFMGNHLKMIIKVLHGLIPAIILHEKVTKTIIKEGRGENPSKYSTCFCDKTCFETLQCTVCTTWRWRCRPKQKARKKSRKAMLKLGMKAIPECEQRHSRESKNVDPCLGQFKAPRSHHVISKPESSAMARGDEDVDETGGRAKRRELVMMQVGVSRSKAIKSQGHDGDIVLRHHGANELREPFGAYSHG